MLRALTYSIQEAWESLGRSRLSGLVSVMTITVALLILGAFLVVTSNLQQLLAAWQSAAEISVYVADTISPEQRAALDDLLAGSRAVASHEFVSKSQALARFRAQFADLAPVAATFPHNPFPASFDVRLRQEARQAQTVDSLAASLRKMAGVSDVRYDRVWLERLLLTLAALQAMGWVLAGIVVVGAALTVSNVVRLTCYARRHELEIMRLVGAPMAYVRGPFVMEGALQGGAGALVALLVLWSGFAFIRGRYGEMALMALGIPELRFLPVQLCIGLVVGGMAVGCAGGLVASLGTEAGEGLVSAAPVAEAQATH
ncbi:MAG: ABC transporter permease [Acidobacteria bacterium]|nr:ABC transporter permease [Acidobacteriota bacterium]